MRGRLRKIAFTICEFCSNVFVHAVEKTIIVVTGSLIRLSALVFRSFVHSVRFITVSR